MSEPQRMIGGSQTLSEVLDQVSALGGIQRPVLILGERGSGKELIAERLHFLSQRWDQAFLKVNCAAISEQLLESELFGHEPGAFTGANRVHHGRFERADGGTLFLDELGTMSLGLQEKLLRLIEYGEFERLGGQKTLKVDVRIVAATNADLKQQVEQGKFREDLLDRLAFDVVHVPPLRERQDDIEELVEFFGMRMSHELGWDLFPGFAESALEELKSYQWPGNIRELKNVVERSVFRWGIEDQAITQVFIDPFENPWQKSQKTVSPKSATEDESVANHPLNFKQQVQELEIKLLRDALKACQFNQTKAAEYLEMSYDQLRGLIKKYPQVKLD